MRKIKAIVHRPDEQYGHMTYVSDSLQALQKTVDGYIETFMLPELGAVIICNEEGKIRRDIPYNCTLWDPDEITTKPVENFYGTLVVCGIDGDEFADCPITLKEWRKLIGRIER